MEIRDASLQCYLKTSMNGSSRQKQRKSCDMIPMDSFNNTRNMTFVKRIMELIE